MWQIRLDLTCYPPKKKRADHVMCIPIIDDKLVVVSSQEWFLTKVTFQTVLWRFHCSHKVDCWLPLCKLTSAVFPQPFWSRGTFFLHSKPTRPDINVTKSTRILFSSQFTHKPQLFCLSLYVADIDKWTKTHFKYFMYLFFLTSEIWSFPRTH